MDNDGLTDAEALAPAVDLRQALRKTGLTAQYPFVGLGQAQGLMYVGLGLAGEAGEVANQIKKIPRDDGGFVTEARRTKIFSELGDIIWYWLRVCDELNFDPNAVIRANQAKLGLRAANGTIQGDGEERAPRAHLIKDPYAGKELGPDGKLRPHSSEGS
jgi:NTP pyrophosphatase (non-canonical NTP hydrolase)